MKIEIKKSENKYKELIEGNRDNKLKEKREEILDLILSLIEWNFELKVSWDFGTRTRKMYKLFVSKKRTGKLTESTDGGEMGFEAPRMDKDLMRKNIDILFLSGELNYSFEDDKLIITLDHDGWLQIKEKKK